mgnify:CR=1 FL=1
MLIERYIFSNNLDISAILIEEVDITFAFIIFLYNLFINFVVLMHEPETNLFIFVKLFFL